MRISSSSSRALAVIVAAASALATGAALSAPPAAAAETTVCHDVSLPHQRTDVSTDVSVPQFDPALGTLLEVTVPGQTVHLDTDAAFESIAASAVVFAEHMDYQVTFASPGGLASPPAIAGTIQRVPPTNLTAFDGTLDYLGTSAVTQPSTARDESASAVSATDAATLAAFTGSGSMPFHLASAISETFTGGGGNVQGQINTFVQAAVTVCYRYRTPDGGGETFPPPAAAPPAPVASPPRTAG